MSPATPLHDTGLDWLTEPWVWAVILIAASVTQLWILRLWWREEVRRRHEDELDRLIQETATKRLPVLDPEPDAEAMLLFFHAQPEVKP
jgi:hypothetical protein